MKVFAPGKIVLSGAYAVLEGAPAIVLATTRGALAGEPPIGGSPSASRSRPPSPEVLAALGGETAPEVDASALFEGDKKLGLGASSAILVASLGFLAARAGEELSRPEVRASLFERALAAHATAQGGGSGVDVAAAVHGGALLFRRSLTGGRECAPVVLPEGIVWRAFFSGTSASTSELRSRVDALKANDGARFDQVMLPLRAAADVAKAAIVAGDAGALIGALRDQALGLAALGREADAPIVPRSFAELFGHASSSDAVFLGAGAGGGDIGLYVGTQAPPASFTSEAERRGFFALEGLGIDAAGVRVFRKATGDQNQ